MSLCFALFLIAAILAFTLIVLIVRITGYDQKIRNKYFVKRNRSSEAYKGKRVVIVGASSGIGAELALQYSSMGASIIISARREQNLKDMKAACEKKGSEKCEYVVCDVTDLKQCQNLIQESVAYLGGIHILILCSGIGSIYSFSEVKDLNSHHTLMDVNYWGSVNCTFYGLPELKKSKGTLAVVSSLTGKFGLPGRTAYCSSKFAVNGFFNALRLEMKEEKTGVNVCVLCPGYVLTEFQEKSIGAQQVHSKATSMFATAQQCASEMIEHMEDGSGEYLMTTKGKIASILGPVVPQFIFDGILAKTVKKSSNYKK